MAPSGAYIATVGQQQANGWEDELDEVADKEGPLPVPSSKQLDAVRQICLAGFGDHVARFVIVLIDISNS